jgi:hypothetical protein
MVVKKPIHELTNTSQLASDGSSFSLQSAGDVAAARSDFHRTEGGVTPTPAPQSLVVRPIGFVVARRLLEREHYLHSFPGGTKLAFGVFLGRRLMGALTLGVGPINSHLLVDGATPDDCLTLTRLWLCDELPRNSESRFIGVVLRSLKNHTSLKFLLAYADPARGHVGTIYQATNWLYTGLSQATPLYDIGDGQQHHSRSLGHVFGSHGLAHLRRQGVQVQLVPQRPKHRYLYFLDSAWRSKVRTPILPYPPANKPNYEY